MVDFCQLVDFYVVMMTSLLCTRKMTSLLLQENSDFQLVISYTVFLVHDNACMQKEPGCRVLKNEPSYWVAFF